MTKETNVCFRTNDIASKSEVETNYFEADIDAESWKFRKALEYCIEKGFLAKKENMVVRLPTLDQINLGYMMITYPYMGYPLVPMCYRIDKIIRG